MGRMAWMLALRKATAHACCARQHQRCAVQALCTMSGCRGTWRARGVSPPRPHAQRRDGVSVVLSDSIPYGAALLSDALRDRARAGVPVRVSALSAWLSDAIAARASCG